MVKVTIDEYYITFDVSNGGNNDLKCFYSVEYFEFIGLNPEIYITPKKGNSNIVTGGYFQDIASLTIPYRYLVKFVEGDSSNIAIKKVSMPKNDDGEPGFSKKINDIKDSLFDSFKFLIPKKRETLYENQDVKTEPEIEPEPEQNLKLLQ